MFTCSLMRTNAFPFVGKREENIVYLSAQSHEEHKCTDWQSILQVGLRVYFVECHAVENDKPQNDDGKNRKVAAK